MRHGDTKEPDYTVRRRRRLEGVGLDVRLGFRMLRKSWGMTLLGGLAMAAAIGIGTAAFAFVKAYQGSALPFDEGDRVVRLMAVDHSGGSTSEQDFEWWREEMRSVEEVSAAWTAERLLVAGNGSDSRISIAQMSASGFRVARVQPHLGRTLSEEDERPDAARVVVIGYETWQSRFAGDRAVLGQNIQIGGLDHAVVGVMPRGFRLPVNQQAWTPFRAHPASGGRPANAQIMVFGRLSPGATIEMAQAEVAARGPARMESRTAEQARVQVAPYAESLARTPSWWNAIPMLLALLLVPPCANVAILVYARNVSRQGEFAARHVLGAGRGRIVGQLLVEAMVLTAAAAGAGLGLGYQLMGVVRRGIDQDPSFPFWVQPEISAETVVYVAALAAFAALVAGGLPALRATGGMRQSALQGLGSRTSPRLGRTWATLVVLQVALTTAVLPRFGESVWTFIHPYLTGREFAAEQFVTAQLVLEGEQTGDTAVAGSRDLPAELVRRVQSDIGALGATVSAAIDGINEETGWMEADGAARGPFLVGANDVDLAYFDVFEASLLAGRAFEPADFNPGRPVVVVDRTFAEQLGVPNPLGKRIRSVHDSEDQTELEPWHEIVGVVERISPSAQRPFVYHPISPAGAQRMSLTLRVGPSVRPDLSRRLVAATMELAPNLQVEQLRTLDGMYRAERREEALFGLGFGALSLLPLLFSAAGIYTLVAFAVQQRRKEIGIRSALGASPLRLATDAFRVDLAPVLAGIVVGAVLALPGYSVSFVASALASLLMLTVGALAVSGPVHRALRIDATEALREN